jgi:hypothetical protein
MLLLEQACLTMSPNLFMGLHKPVHSTECAMLAAHGNWSALRVRRNAITVVGQALMTLMSTALTPVWALPVRFHVAIDECAPCYLAWHCSTVSQAPIPTGFHDRLGTVCAIGSAPLHTAQARPLFSPYAMASHHSLKQQPSCRRYGRGGGGVRGVNAHDRSGTVCAIDNAQLHTAQVIPVLRSYAME